MKKIPNLFARDENGDLTDEINPDCEWVVKGEGTATRKFDGTSCFVYQGELWKRRILKPGKPVPVEFLPCGAPDPNTGKIVGWVLADESDKWHMEAIRDGLPIEGTYELCGPKIQGNPEKFDEHVLIPHGNWILLGAPTDPAHMKGYLNTQDIEGIVWWHQWSDQKCKLRKQDFGLKR
jgi:hypothetical protein